MKIISIEEHFVTREITTAWETSTIGSEGTSSFDQGEIGQRLEDLGEGRLALMDESGVDVQVLSVTTPALHNLEPGESVRLGDADERSNGRDDRQASQPAFRASPFCPCPRQTKQRWN